MHTGRKAMLRAAILITGYLGAAASPARAADWDWILTPYLWGSSMKVDVFVKDEPVFGEDLSFPDLLDQLDLGFQLHFEGQRGKAGFFLDLTYLAVSDSETTPANPPLPGGTVLGVDIDTTLFEAAGFYRPSGEALGLEPCEGEQEGPLKVAHYLIGRSVKSAFEDRLPPVHPPRSRRRESEAPPPEPTSPYRPILEWFSGDTRLELGDDMTSEEHLAKLREVPGLEKLARKHLGAKTGADLGAAMEFVLEGLHQSSVLAKEETEGRKTFLDMLQTMFSSLEEN